MTDLFLADPDVTLHLGDCLEVLRGLPDGSVHMACCSPPFYGLRDYQVDGQIGLEDTPDQWVQRLVEVFREVRRVLRDDGTCWIEIGDSYAGSWGAQSRDNGSGEGSLSAGQIESHTKGTRTGSIPAGAPYKPKDLLGAPWLLAFALRADGWYLRSEIIWAKPNPMPESVTDRPTTSHSRVFLLAKSGRLTYWTNPMRDWSGVRSKPEPDYWWFPPPGETGAPSLEPVEGWKRRNVWEGHDYYYDAEVIREPWQSGTAERYAYGYNASWKRAQEASVTDARTDGFQGSAEALLGRDGERWPGPGRNRRSVWTVATQPYPEAHFATWPEKLVEPMILAGTSERGVCPECGAPWERIVERGELVGQDRGGNYNGREIDAGVKRNPGTPGLSYETATTGWRPTCDHQHDPVPAVVLDPFAGSGTTNLVARRLGRRSIGIDLNAEYLQLAARRLQQLSLFAPAERTDR